MLDIFGDGRHISVNIMGNAAGVLIFGIFLVLLLSHRSTQELRTSMPSPLAAALALIWNAASLLVAAIGDSHRFAADVVAGAGFCALSLLPSVLLDICLRKQLRIIVRLGYLVSAVAALSHIIELFRDAPDFHRLGLAIITIGFGLLSAAAVLAVLWSSQDNPGALSIKIISAMFLFLFAISFVHFTTAISPNAWLSELALHHGGIFLALFVIMQDYRFILLDAFVRFLVNCLLAVIVAVPAAWYGSSLSFPLRVALFVGVLSGFTFARGLLQRLLTRIVFRQPEAESVLREIRSLGAQATDESAYIERVNEFVADLLSAPVCPMRSSEIPQSADLGGPILAGANPPTRALHEQGIEVIVPIGLSKAKKQYLCLGARRGGRRYLSEELGLLARIAACVVEQTDRIRESETRRLVGEAELRALQAQINPHFLFNAFNALYGVIPRQATGARKTVLNLAEVFRYFLQNGKTFVTIEEELRIVRAYLEIEELRLGDRLRISFDVDGAALRESVPALSIQPLVENAVKHGIAARPEGGEVQIQARHRGDTLYIGVRDTGPGFGTNPTDSRTDAGVGMENVSRRLVLCYGSDARLRIESASWGTTVSFIAPCECEAFRGRDFELNAAKPARSKIKSCW